MKTSSRRAFDPRSLSLVAKVVAVVLLGVGGLMGYQAWRQFQDQSAAQQVDAARQAMVDKATRTVGEALRAIETASASAAVRAAVEAGDYAAAGTAAGIKGAQQVQVLPSDLAMEYDAAKPDYTRLMVLEHALQDGKGYAAVHQDGKALIAASPVLVDGRAVAVVYAQFPAKDLKGAGAVVDDAGYVGLHQGPFVVFKQGNARLGEDLGAEKTAIKQSALSVVHKAPESTEGFMGSAIAALVALLLAGAAGVASKRLGKPRVAVVEAPEITVAQVQADLRAKQPSVAPAPVRTPKPAVVVPVDEGVAREALFAGGIGPGMIEAGVPREKAVQLGVNLGQWLHAAGIGAVTIGRDGRASSTELMEGVIEGLVASGRNVHDAGMAPTPVVAFAASQVGAGASIAVVGSPRSITNTGILLTIGGTHASLDTLDAAAAGAGAYEGTPGSRETIDATENYLAQLGDGTEVPRRLVVAVMGEYEDLLSRALARQGVVVADTDAEMTLALTDNGSALSVCDARGMPIAASQILLALAVDLMDRVPGSDMVCDATTAETIAAQVLARGGIAQVAGPDIQSIQASAVERAAALAGDAMGHILLLERGFTVPDGFLAGVRLAEIIGFAHHADDVLAGEA